MLRAMQHLLVFSVCLNLEKLTLFVCSLSGHLSRTKSWVQRPAGWSLDCLTCLSCRPRSSCFHASLCPKNAVPQNYSDGCLICHLLQLTKDSNTPLVRRALRKQETLWTLKVSPSKYSTCWLSSVFSFKKLSSLSVERQNTFICIS